MTVMLMRPASTYQEPGTARVIQDGMAMAHIVRVSSQGVKDVREARCEKDWKWRALGE